MTKNGIHQLSSIIPHSVISQFGKKIRTFPLIFLLLFPVAVLMVTEAISPQIVRAYTARANLTIDRLPDESYEAILRRAETTARAAAQRSFDQDILVTDVSVIVSVQSYGEIAPILSLEVARQQWRSRPDARRWAKYYKTARSLLNFEQETTTPNPTPSPQTKPAEPPAAPLDSPPTNQPQK